MNHPRPIADEPHDPHLWLEEVTSDAALAWAAARTDETENRFASDERTALASRLEAVLDDPDRLVVPSRHGEWMYDLWRDAENPRGLWRRSSRRSFRAGEPDWDVLVDVDALGRAENTAWSFAGTVHGPAGTDRALVKLSPDGGDATVVREFDLGAAAFVNDGAFGLDLHKSFVAWIDRDALLVATAADGGGSTESGYPSSARVWRRGAELSSAPAVVLAEASDVGVFLHVDRTAATATAVVDVARDFFHSDTFVWDASIDPAPRRVDAPRDALIEVHGATVVIRTTTAWRVGGVEHPGGTLLVGSLAGVLADPAPDDAAAGEATAPDAAAPDAAPLVAVFTPTATTVIESWTWTKTRLVLTLLDDVQTTLISLDPDDAWARWDVPLNLEDDDLFTASIATCDADEDDEIWIVARGFLTPPTLIVTDAVHPAPEVIDSARATFDAAGLAVAQHWTRSADGTRIPYFEVGPRQRSGEEPVLMNGYGGFEHALTPEYPTLVGPAWLERGGVYVVANIRGGGEFGPAWHLAALRENRHRAYADFVAVARDLVNRGVTTANRIGCHGRSNGGLLVGNMLTTYPEDFGAIVCGVPLLDMRRYTRLSAGASWIAEYGDPDDTDDWAFLADFSPYHRVDASRTYPPSLIYAATSDDRVGPVQARKMAERLRCETTAEVHYLEPVDGGHSGTIDNSATAALHATIYAFLVDVLIDRVTREESRYGADPSGRRCRRTATASVAVARQRLWCTRS